MKFNHKLAAYSAFAAAAVANTKIADAQIVFEDIDPDIYIETDYDIVSLDMNGDGIMDFEFKGVSFYFSSAEVLDTYYIHVTALGENRVAYAVENQNFNVDCYSSYWSSAASTSTWCAVDIAASRFVTPIISFGAAIDTGAYDFRSGMLILGEESETGAYGLYATDDCPVDFCWVDDSWAPTFGPWAYGTHDAYIGVQLSIDGAMHNGYIHVLVYNASSPSGYAYIKDYGYNTTAGEPIFAGDTMNCVVPEITSTLTTPFGFKLFFDEADGTNQYKVRYREAGGGGTWQVAANALPHVMVSGLECNTTYEYKYKVACGMGGIVKGSEWSDVNTITTGDCRMGFSQEELQARVYPNPTGSTFTVESMLGLAPAHLIIRNASGQVIRSYTDQDAPNYSVQDLPSGMYIITMEWDEISATEVLFVE